MDVVLIAIPSRGRLWLLRQYAWRLTGSEPLCRCDQPNNRRRRRATDRDQIRSEANVETPAVIMQAIGTMSNATSG
jgi:hypothetical protein